MAIGVVALSAVVATSQPGLTAQGSLSLAQARLYKQTLRDTPFNAAEEQYLNRALPNTTIAMEQALKATSSFGDVQNQGNEHGDQNGNGGWQLIGPTVPTVPGPVTYTGRATTDAGRVTSLAIAPTCVPGNCRLYVGAAGGGVWITDDALAVPARWRASSAGMQSNSIGSITIDPTDPSGRTIYAGTGEPNGSTDSEAGIGLYKSTNGGRSWQLVQGSVPVSRDRSIAAVAVDPTNANHLLIGTAVARHGHSAVYGGRHTPPGAPQIGIYESTNGGQTWSAALILPQDTTTSSTSGGDFFRGGISDIQVDKLDPTTVYASTFVFGVYRRAPHLDGDGSFRHILSGNDESPGASSVERAQIAVTVKNGHTRVYAGLGNGATAHSNLWRADNADQTAALLFASKASGSGAGGLWKNLSNPTPGTPGFASFDWCGGQCSYDMPIATPAGRPDSIWIGAQMQYSDIGQGAIGAPSPSNGRTIQRSVDGGESFTDMTNDTQSPPLGMHPDQHAIVFASSNADIAFLGSDGGVVRTSGQFADTSDTCTDPKRKNTGANLVDCQMWLKAIPTRIFSLNAGLATLQYQHVSINPHDPRNDVMGGTQDNGTWAWSGSAKSWFESVGGDGGLSGTDIANPNTRIHSYTGTEFDMNFHGTAVGKWDYISGPMHFNDTEFGAFYAPVELDPTVSGTIFAGMQHVWRTQNNGGSQAYLDATCNEQAYNYNIPDSVAINCGDWVAIGGGNQVGDDGDLTGPFFGADRQGFYIVAIARAASDNNVMWAATRRGRIFVSTNAQAPAADVRYTRIDSSATPGRFVSNIVVDPTDANHAWISYSGYSAFTPTTPGHVFDVHFNGATASFTDLSYNLGDQPITALARDNQTGNLYAATDFGVVELHAGKTTWRQAASGLPPVAVYSLALSTEGRVLYAATHGRSIYQLELSGDVNDGGGASGG